MVSTRRSSGSISSNNSKRSASSDDKSTSPKRKKGEKSVVAEKSTQTSGSSENSKELSSSPASDLLESTTPADPPVSTVVDVTTTAVDSSSKLRVEDGGNGDMPSVSAATPAADGSSPILVDKPRSSFSSWSMYQKQNPIFDSSAPWCKLLTEYSQNPHITISLPIFTIGASRQSNFCLKDPAVSATLCRIKQSQRDGVVVAVLESTGSKGSVRVNGKTIKKNTSTVINSGDELVFSSTGNHAYIFQNLAISAAPSSVGVADAQTGKRLQPQRRSGDPSAVTGASILASLSRLKQDLSLLTPPAQNNGEAQQGTNASPCSLARDGSDMEVDDQDIEDKLEHILGSDTAAEIGTSGKNLQVDNSQESGIDPDPVKTSGVNDTIESVMRMFAGAPLNGNSKDMVKQVLDEVKELERRAFPDLTSGISPKYAALKDDILAGILDEKEIEVTYMLVVNAAYIHLKRREYAKYAAELPTVSPKLLLSGPAGSEIYQEMLAKALANHFAAKLLIFDSGSFLEGLSAKEMEQLKDGLRAKKRPGNTDLVKSKTPSGEAETPNSEIAQSSGRLESQPKLEANPTPSSMTSKSRSLKLGDRVKFVGLVSAGLYPTTAPSRGPTYGSRGRVLLPFEDNISSKIGV